MSTSFTRSTTFNRSHARGVATKMAADLHRMQRLYGWPTETTIANLVEEVTELLASDLLESVEVGFERSGQRVVSLRYTARRDGTLSGDDNAGGLPRGVDISGCDRINYMRFNSSWHALSAVEQAAVEAKLPYVRTEEPEPVDGSGYWHQDRVYSTNGSGTVRTTFRPFS